MSNLKDKLSELTTLVKALETWEAKNADGTLDIDVLVSFGDKIEYRLSFDVNGELELESF